MSLIAIEMKNNPEYATQIVMGTTILSAVTMPLFITIAYYLFPIILILVYLYKEEPFKKGLLFFTF